MPCHQFTLKVSHSLPPLAHVFGQGLSAGAPGWGLWELLLIIVGIG